MIVQQISFATYQLTVCGIVSTPKIASTSYYSDLNNHVILGDNDSAFCAH